MEREQSDGPHPNASSVEPPPRAAETWQPLRQRPHGARLFVVLAIAALIAIGTLWAFSQLATNSPDKLNLGGDRRFLVRKIDATAQEIAESGPVLLPALAPSKADLFLQHLGGDEFVAFSALAPGKGRECALRWDRISRTFDDPCSDATFPADGTGLGGYYVLVDRDADVIEIDPRRPLASPASATAPTSAREAAR
jgi:hypothetical protein